jgi:hypothetical protein
MCGSSVCHCQLFGNCRCQNKRRSVLALPSLSASRKFGLLVVNKSETEIVTNRLHNRIAGINLGRLIQTIQCNEEDFTYCFIGSSMIVVGEMSTGILVACVPTLGPVFFPTRLGPSANARYQYKDSRRTPLHNGASGRTPFRGSASDVSDERPFTTLEEGDIQLKSRA